MKRINGGGSVGNLIRSWCVMMPSECHREQPECGVSYIDYSEARNILDLTSVKQKRLRCQRPYTHNIRVHLLLKRTYKC
ncbi:unnamed protein product, partial [Didymodactylos carnosus]